MRDTVTIIRERQCQIRRELDRRHVSLKGIAFDSGIPYPTLQSYFPDPEAKREPAQIPGGAIYALCGAMPADLLSLLLPDGFQIVRAPEVIDHDALCEIADDYVRTKMAAHRADSEAGVAIAPKEKTLLDGKVVALRGAAA